jgi:DMSO reductase anchor subunit
LVLLVGFAALAAVLAVVGFVLGADLAVWKAHRYVDQILISDPRQPRGIQITTALLFAWPALVAGMACAIHRWRKNEEPSNRAAILYFAIPLVVIGGMHVARWLFFPMPPAGGLQPMIALTEFAPGKLDAQLAALTAIVQWLYIGVRRS